MLRTREHINFGLRDTQLPSQIGNSTERLEQIYALANEREKDNVHLQVLVYVDNETLHTTYGNAAHRFISRLDLVCENLLWPKKTLSYSYTRNVFFFFLTLRPQMGQDFLRICGTDNPLFSIYEKNRISLWQTWPTINKIGPISQTAAIVAELNLTGIAT